MLRKHNFIVWNQQENYRRSFENFVLLFSSSVFSVHLWVYFLIAIIELSNKSIFKINAKRMMINEKFDLAHYVSILNSNYIRRFIVYFKNDDDILFNSYIIFNFDDLIQLKQSLVFISEALLLMKESHSRILEKFIHIFLRVLVMMQSESKFVIMLVMKRSKLVSILRFEIWWRSFLIKFIINDLFDLSFSFFFIRLNANEEWDW